MAGDAGYLTRPSPSGLADVIETILNRGLVIDAYVRVSLLGIELLTLDARVTIASVDTFLRFAEATNRLDLWEQGGRTLPELLEEGTQRVVRTIAANVVENKIEDGIDTVKEKVGDTVDTVVEKTADVAGKAAGFVERAVEAVTPGDHDDDHDEPADRG